MLQRKNRQRTHFNLHLNLTFRSVFDSLPCKNQVTRTSSKHCV